MTGIAQSADFFAILKRKYAASSRLQMPSPVLLDHGFASSEDREIKARKIEAVVANFMGTCEVAACNILDIGCGSGHIAAYFTQRNRVIACDVVDQVTSPQRAHFELVIADTVHLPFANGGFDVILSNHVMAYSTRPTTPCTRNRPTVETRRSGLFSDAQSLFPTRTAYQNASGALAAGFPVPMDHAPTDGAQRCSPCAWLLGDRCMVWCSPSEKSGLYHMRIINDPERFHMPAPRRVRLPEACKWLSPTCVFMLSR